MRKVRESESEGSCEDDEESIQMTYLCSSGRLDRCAEHQ